MKSLLLIISIFINSQLQSQTFSNNIAITKTFSEDGRAYIESTPFDKYTSSLNGKSKIFKDNMLLYTIDRPFTTYYSRNFVAISDDAQYVIYIIERNYNVSDDKLKNVTIYKNGILIKTFSSAEFSNCDPAFEKCNLVADIGLDIVDEEKSIGATIDWIYYDGVTKEEILLFKNPVFIQNDTIYCTNSKLSTTILDLKNQKIIDMVDYKKVYSKYVLSDFNRKSENKKFTVPREERSNFPNLKSGETIVEAFSKKFGLKAFYHDEREDYNYKYFHIEVKGLINREGILTLKTLKVKDKLQYEAVKQFLESQRYDVDFLPVEFDKFLFETFPWRFRDANDKVALKTTKAYEIESKAIRESRFK